MAIEGNVNLPTSGSECTEGVASQHFHDHLFMPPKPAFTRQEEWQKTLHAVNSALAKVIALEDQCREKVDSMLSVISSDNVEFKNLMTSTYNEFANTVKNEVNSFESLIVNAYELFKATMNNDFNDYVDAFVEFKKTTNSIVNDFEDTVNLKIQEINTYFRDNFGATIRQELRNLKATGEMAEIIDKHLLDHLAKTSDLAELATKSELEIERQRINNITTLPNGSTSGDAELADIRVGADGVNHPSAGESVRTQFNKVNAKVDTVEESNPFKYTIFDNRAYYKGGAIKWFENGSYDSAEVCDFSAYLAAEDEMINQNYGIAGHLKHPIPLDSDVTNHFFIVESSDVVSGTILLTSDPNWGTGTSWGADVEISKGLNVINVSTLNHNVTTATEFKYVVFRFNKSTIPEAFSIRMVSNSALLGHLYEKSERTLVKDLTYSDLIRYTREISYTYNVENNRVYMDVPEQIVRAGNWSYSLLSVKLGKYKDCKNKLFVISNPVGEIRYFCIGKTYSAWMGKTIPTSECPIVKRVSDFESVFTDDDNVYISICLNYDNQNGTSDMLIKGVRVSACIDIYNLDANNPLCEFILTGADKFVKKYELVEEGFVTKEELGLDGYSKKEEQCIVCWGDSLTAGGGWTQVVAERSGFPVFNAGTGGENSATIMARQGGDVMVVNNFTIPADKTPVVIATRSGGSFKTELGSSVAPLLQGGSSHVNPVRIGDVEGDLTWTGNSYSDQNGVWTFTRSTEGEAINITRPTAIRTAYDRNHNNPYLMIIFMGTNDGNPHPNPSELLRKHKMMINHANAKHVIILGISRGTEEGLAEYERLFTQEFGRYFIPLRKYLATPIYDEDGEVISCYGLADQNLAAGSATYNGVTYNAIDEIKVGSVPHQILADDVHYTQGTKDVIGSLIYKRCKELGIF